MKYRIGTRGSKLAVAQTEYVKRILEAAWPGDSFETVIIRTQGDKVQNRSLDQIGGKGVFVAEIEECLLNGTIDLAVHSMKDMPGEMTPGLTFAKAWKREDPRDVLVLREASCLAELPAGAVVGTGSLRRSLMLRRLRPDLQIVPIRGNIDTRIRKMQELPLDGIVLAAAGIRRIGRENVITQYLEPEEMIPAAAQGTLAIQLREDRVELLQKLNALSDEDTQRETEAERAFLAEVGADCHLPAGAYCRCGEDGTLRLMAVYGTGKDEKLYEATVTGRDPRSLAREAASEICRQMAEAAQAEEAAQAAEAAGQKAEDYGQTAPSGSRREPEAAISRASCGKVYLLGAGPGDPELITVRGMKLLQQADCVVYDRLISPKLLDYLPAGCERIYVGKEDHHHTMPQEEIQQLLAQKARQYSCVIRLKGGDPYVFGRGGEEGLYLREQGIPFEEVPGISSALAGPACAGIPVTHRGLAYGFHVITAHDRKDHTTEIDYRTLRDPRETCIFLMGLSKVREIAENLIRAGRDPQTPAAVISSATTPAQRTCAGNLQNIADRVDAAQLTSPALILVGEVAGLRPELDWYENRPLFGRRYLVTKIGEETSRLSDGLRQLGARTEEVMTGKLRFLPENLTRQDLREADWVLFSSRNGVKGFFDAVFAWKADIRILAGIRFGVVGDKTAQALEAYGILPDLIPSRASAAVLAQELADYVQNEQNVRILNIQGEGAPDQMADLLQPVACYRRVDIYCNAPAEIPAGMDWKQYDGIFFTAASSVERLLAADGGEDLRRLLEEEKAAEGREAWDGKRRKPVICVIGRTCGKALQKYGITDYILPRETSYEAMIQSEVDRWQNMPTS